jgi:hypothetical protein
MIINVPENILESCHSGIRKPEFCLLGMGRILWFRHNGTCHDNSTCYVMVELARIGPLFVNAGRGFGVTTSAPGGGAEDCINHAIRTCTVKWSHTIFILLQHHLYCFVLSMRIHFKFSSTTIFWFLDYCMNPWSISFYWYVYVCSSRMVKRPDMASARVLDVQAAVAQNPYLQGLLRWVAEHTCGG